MYYIMSCEGPNPIAPVEVYPDLPGGPWFTGARLGFQVPQPLRFKLSTKRRGNAKAFYGPRVPLIRMDLLAALQEAGVDNLELFDAILEDPVTGAGYTDYKALNVLGLVAAADMTASEWQAGLGRELIGADLIDVFFEKLVLDPRLTQGLLFFRLAQSANAVVIHEQVKKVVDARGVPGMVFYEPKDWGG